MIIYILQQSYRLSIKKMQKNFSFGIETLYVSKGKMSSNINSKALAFYYSFEIYHGGKFIFKSLTLKTPHQLCFSLIKVG